MSTTTTSMVAMSDQALAFRTGFDRPGDEIANEQYQKGLEIGENYAEFHIARNWVWSASVDGAYCWSYERLGYHAATAELFQGILDSGIEIIDHRN